MDNLYIKLLEQKYDLFRVAVQSLNNIKIEVYGDSMHPTISTKELVTITKVSETDIVVGDILLYVSTKYDLVLHRVIKKKFKQLVMKGDNESYLDTISTNSVIGKKVDSSCAEYQRNDQNGIFESLFGAWRISLIIKHNVIENVKVEQV